MPRLVRIAGPAVVLGVALLSLFAGLQFGGGAAASPLSDPGAAVRYGLPIATLFVDLSAAGTIGALVLVCFALSHNEPEFERALDVAAGSAAVWAVSSAATGFFTFLSIYQEPVSSGGRFGELLGNFLTTIAPGQAWLATTLIAAVTTVLCFAVRSHTALVFVTVFAGAGLIPIALQGHSAGTAGHDAATTSLGLHLVFVAVWLGGLLTIVLIRGALVPGRIGPVISRYSTLALVCFLVVAASGVVNASLRLGDWPALLTPYGILVLVKVAALGALGFFGLAQRRFLIERMQRAVGGARYFWWLIVAELGFMGLASGTAAALARTATPVPQVKITTTPAFILTGEALPPELTLPRYITQWRFDLLWVLVIAFLAFFYLAGVWRLRRRGDSWPVHRTILWLAGLALLFYSTNGGVNVYEKYLFSVHMFMHMMLTMMVPLLLVPGAPVTLAMRTVRKRLDGSRGAREWILWVVHSKVAGVLTNPVVAAGIFAGSLWVFYYSPLFRWAATDHIGHEFMVVHFLLSGYIFVMVLIGIDPLPKRAPYPMRLIVLLGTLAFHAFFGLTLMTGSGLLLADWFGAMGRTWGASAIVDQQVGGGIAWSVGEIPTAVLALTVAYLWFRSDSKEARRMDRQSDRSGNADVADYNAMLARLDTVPDDRPPVR
ncbi:cytochrome c oxidase assembly protein [Parafrigoribacterium mesophilum]|uniref:cytochrome c oxidase assembly protein n=1 Tax=Parafrigoribacterium mesophilum TaxID=433646 RepID=UPI0031FC0E79